MANPSCISDALKKKMRREFLESFVQNEDGSVTFERQGTVEEIKGRNFNYGLYFDEDVSVGIPLDASEHVSDILGELKFMGYGKGDVVKYKVTIQPKSHSE